MGIYAIAEINGQEDAQKFVRQLLNSKHGSTTETKNLVEFYYANLELEWSNNFVLKLSKFLNQKNE